VDIWSVGCIFAEFLSRKIFLPGQSGFEQLQLILQKIGTPDEDVIQRIPSERSREYLRRLPRYPKLSLYKRFPNANILAIDLLEKMIAFEPNARISAADALKHPYLARFHDPSREPDFPCFNFSFDAKCKTLGDLKSKCGKATEHWCANLVVDCILEEVSFTQLSARIPASVPFKEHPLLLVDISKDPAVLAAPSNVMQPGYSNLVNSRSRELTGDDSEVSAPMLPGHNADTDQSVVGTAAAKSFYQAFKKGLKRLGSIRRNNSA
jgi:serine/threonine protein kinase